MRIWDIALKDLSQILKDKKSLIFLLAMPIAFTVFFGLIFASPDGGGDALVLLGYAALFFALAIWRLRFE